MRDNKWITVKAYKYGNHPHYEWQAQLLEHSEEYIIAISHPGKPLTHHTKNKVFTIDNWYLEFFSLNHGYTVSGRVQGDRFVSFYCNIIEPASFDGQTISFIDLDIDVVKNENSSWEVIDEDEFLQNSVRYHYPPALIQKVRTELQSLLRRIENNCFPFDGSLYKYIKLMTFRKAQQN